MPRWKTTANIARLKDDGEHFDENWMNRASIWDYAPPFVPWDGSREIRLEDVDLWEVIAEFSSSQGWVGVYGAELPFAEYYIVMTDWSLLLEFNGRDANARLEKWMIERGIVYPFISTAPHVDRDTVAVNR